MIRFLQPPIKRLYLKEFPFHLNEKAKHRVKLAGEFSGIVVLTAFLVYVFLNNITPFGITIHYSLLQNSPNLSNPGPKNRVKIENTNGQLTFHQLHDLVYFTTAMPFQFD